MVGMDIDIVYIVIVVGVVFTSMVLHELMHGLTAYWLGDNTAKEHGRLTLNPIKHIDPFLTILLPVMLAIIGGPVFGGAKPVPFRPDKVKGGEWGAALVVIVGPLTNLVLAFICFAIAWFSGVFAVQGGHAILCGRHSCADSDGWHNGQSRLFCVQYSADPSVGWFAIALCCSSSWCPARHGNHRACWFTGDFCNSISLESTARLCLGCNYICDTKVLCDDFWCVI